MLRPCQLVSLLGTVFLLLGEVGHDDDDDKHDDDNDLWGQLSIVGVRCKIDLFFQQRKILVQVRGLGDAVYAVNCGGEAHTDLFGIKVPQEKQFLGPKKLLIRTYGPCVKCKYFQYEKDTYIFSMRKT